MIELTGGDYRALCAAETVRERIGALEGERRAAVRQFWLRGLGGLALAAVAAVLLFRSGWETSAFVAFALILVGAIDRRRSCR